jgi:hypothetical protein
MIAAESATRSVTWITLATSASTLVCCALPALLVALGAGAVLASAVSVFPQLVWISEHKVEVFVVAGVMLFGAGLLQWRAKSLPCPIDPALRNACMAERKISRVIYWMSLAIFATGGFFAFVAAQLFH